jgi:hypothetical protein
MKLTKVKLLLPIIAVTVQSNSASTIIPPYLNEMRVPVAAIGTLISLGPVFALASRLPSGMLYSLARARWLVAVAVLAMGITNFLYSFATDTLTFAVVHSLNGFAYGAVTRCIWPFTLTRSRLVRTATMRWGTTSAAWPWGTQAEIFWAASSPITSVTV